MCVAAVRLIKSEPWDPTKGVRGLMIAAGKQVVHRGYDINLFCAVCELAVCRPERQWLYRMNATKDGATVC